MTDSGSSRQRQAGHHRQDGGEGDGGDEAQEQVAADRLGQMDRRHVGAAHHVGERVDRPVGAGTEELGVVHQQDDGAEADDEGQDVEVADEAGGVEDRLAGFLGVGDGEEAHQDVRQSGGAEHKRDAERNRRDRVLDQGTGLHDRDALGVDVDRGLEQGTEQGPLIDAQALAKITVTAEVVRDEKGPKIDILKYKNKTGYRVRKGHRQQLTRLRVTGIS